MYCVHYITNSKKCFLHKAKRSFRRFEKCTISSPIKTRFNYLYSLAEWYYTVYLFKKFFFYLFSKVLCGSALNKYIASNMDFKVLKCIVLFVFVLILHNKSISLLLLIGKSRENHKINLTLHFVLRYNICRKKLPVR